jgi:hypothetical protein
MQLLLFAVIVTILANFSRTATQILADVVDRCSLYRR